MGFLSNLRRSWKKSSKLRKLQLKISPPNQSTQDFAAILRSGASKRDRALEEFLDLCESDEGVKRVMEIEQLSRSDLEKLYSELLLNGLGQWVKGHYAALSTIAYVEPLLFTIHAKKQGVGMREICVTLLDYWGEKIPQGGLLNE